MGLLNLAESAEIAADLFYTFKDGTPELIPTGIAPVDRAIGGMGPGSAGILATSTGVGKSRLVLSAAMGNSVRTGIISLEDTPDVVGSRAMGFVSGIDNLRIRKKDLSEEEIDKLRGSGNLLADSNAIVAYRVGGSLDDAVGAVEELAEAGCKIVYVDYLQKIRNSKSQDRRNEVSSAYTSLQSAAARKGVALIAVSQLSRQIDMTKPPQIWWLKESGDLENEARLIILGCRDKEDRGIVRFRLAKSTVGAEGRLFAYKTDVSGMLVEVDPFLDEEDF